MMIASGLLLLRLVTGLIFVGHGVQKLFGLFGGHGLTGTSQMMTHLGLRPARWWAIVAALGEFIGGLLLAVGFITPVAALLVCGVMLVAIAKVHWSKGFWNSQGGYEYNLVLLAVAVAIGIMGAGQFSLDALFSLNFPEPQTFLIGALVLVVLLAVAIPVGRWIEQHAGTWSGRIRHPAQA